MIFFYLDGRFLFEHLCVELATNVCLYLFVENPTKEVPAKRGSLKKTFFSLISMEYLLALNINVANDFGIPIRHIGKLFYVDYLLLFFLFVALVKPRPFAKEFLKFCFENYAIAIWS